MDVIDSKILELGHGVFVIPGPTNVGIVTNQTDSRTEVYIIDTGNTELDGEYILEILESFFKKAGTEYFVKAIINTHSHADHTGGNAIIQENTSCEVLAPRFERGAMDNPHLHPAVVWGANPPKDLLTVYYKPDPTTPTGLISEELKISLSDFRELSFLSLPGHSFDHYGVLCTLRDNKKILFAGDAIFPRNEISNYSLPLTIDYIDFQKSLDKIQQIEDLIWCIPGHGEFISRNLSETIETNKISMLEVELCILEILGSRKVTTDEVIQRFCHIFEIECNVRKYSLISFTVKSFLTTMRNKGKVQILIEDNILLWATK